MYGSTARFLGTGIYQVSELLMSCNVAMSDGLAENSDTTRQQIRRSAKLDVVTVLIVAMLGYEITAMLVLFVS